MVLYFINPPASMTSSGDESFFGVAELLGKEQRGDTCVPFRIFLDLGLCFSHTQSIKGPGTELA